MFKSSNRQLLIGTDYSGQSHGNLDIVKHIIDFGAAITAFGTFLSWMPSIASFLSIAWLLTKFHEYFKTKSWYFWHLFKEQEQEQEQEQDL